MTTKQKLSVGTLITVLLLNLGVHVWIEWTALSQSKDTVKGIATLPALAWNSFAGSLEFLISPVGILLMIGLISWCFWMRDEARAKNTGK